MGPGHWRGAIWAAATPESGAEAAQNGNWTGGRPERATVGVRVTSVGVVSEILEVDLLAFERGDSNQRKAVVDGVRRSLETGFVLTRHDVSEDLLDSAYGMLQQFFRAPAEEKQRWNVPGAHGQTGYTGVLVETAASSDTPDWKEMLNWSTPIEPGHPLKRKFQQAYPDQVLPEDTVPGITKVLYEFHDTIADLQRRFLRIIAEGIGCHESFFDEMVADGPTLTRAIRYPPMTESPEGDGSGHYVWAAEHGDINLITALPRATAPGLQVKVDDRVGRRRRSRRAGDHQHRDHARTADQWADSDRLAPCCGRPRVRRRALQRRAVLPPAAVDDPVTGAQLLHAGDTAALPRAVRC